MHRNLVRGVSLVLAIGLVGFAWMWRRAATDRVTLNVRDAPVAEVVDSLQRQTWEPILLRPGQTKTITLSIKNVPLTDALDLAAHQAECSWTHLYALHRSPTATDTLKNALEQGNSTTWANLAQLETPSASLHFAHNTGSEAPLSISLNGRSASEAARSLSHFARAQVILEDNLDGVVHLNLKGVPFEHAVDQLAEQLECHITELFVLSPYFGTPPAIPISTSLPPPTSAGGDVVSPFPPGAEPIMIPLGDSLPPGMENPLAPTPMGGASPEVLTDTLRQDLREDLRNSTPEQRADRWRQAQNTPPPPRP